MTGRLERFRLADILSVSAVGRRLTKVVLNGDDGTWIGEIVVGAGRVVEAHTETAAGMPAFLALMGQQSKCAFTVLRLAPATTTRREESPFDFGERRHVWCSEDAVAVAALSAKPTPIVGFAAPVHDAEARAVAFGISVALEGHVEASFADQRWLDTSHWPMLMMPPDTRARERFQRAVPTESDAGTLPQGVKRRSGAPVVAGDGDPGVVLLSLSSSERLWPSCVGIVVTLGVGATVGAVETLRQRLAMRGVVLLGTIIALPPGGGFVQRDVLCAWRGIPSDQLIGPALPISALLIEAASARLAPEGRALAAGGALPSVWAAFQTAGREVVRRARDASGSSVRGASGLCLQ